MFEANCPFTLLDAVKRKSLTSRRRADTKKRRADYSAPLQEQRPRAEIHNAVSIAPATIISDPGRRCAKLRSLRNRDPHSTVMIVLSLKRVVT